MPRRPQAAALEPERTNAERYVVEAARRLVGWRRWYLGLPEDRELPDPQQGALERVLRALDAEETDHARC
ncbi:hypothetical protein [Methylobacterium flocculans]|uniref:hypothetical protein n=1 Tax=Methylobacterium flocculans TaxID=2984843 RepID=UPI0021F2FD06|nr:hypothetical protein [Methylobacterium sp. FF17]